MFSIGYVFGVVSCLIFGYIVYGIFMEWNTNLYENKKKSNDPPGTHGNDD